MSTQTLEISAEYDIEYLEKKQRTETFESASQRANKLSTYVSEVYEELNLQYWFVQFYDGGLDEYECAKLAVIVFLREFSAHILETTGLTQSEWMVYTDPKEMARIIMDMDEKVFEQFIKKAYDVASRHDLSYALNEKDEYVHPDPNSPEQLKLGIQA